MAKERPVVNVGTIGHIDHGWSVVSHLLAELVKRHAFDPVEVNTDSKFYVNERHELDEHRATGLSIPHLERGSYSKPCSTKRKKKRS